ncbi:MAG: hypothetical protein FWC53_02235 [Firmicutes bacterium]|nr:hypothetical protein [Bacillota bacterium]
MSKNKKKSKNLNIKKLPKLEAKNLKRLTVLFILAFILLFLAVFRVGWIQFAPVFDGHNLKEDAYKQQVADRSIPPQRGSIYDSSRKAFSCE